MIHPSASEVLATVLSTFSREIVPELSTVEARSSAATIEHLLRHVLLRIDREGDVLMRDIARLRVLLTDIADWLTVHSPEDAAGVLAVLAEFPGDLTALASQGEEAMRLRGALVSVRQALERLEPGHGGAPPFQALRAAIGTYIGAQLADEATLIEPAFSGRGPRR